MMAKNVLVPEEDINRLQRVTEAAGVELVQLRAANAAMSRALKSIREYIITLEADALGTDAMFGYSYRDEMVDSIDKALEVE